MRPTIWNISEEEQRALDILIRDEAFLATEQHSYLPKTHEEYVGFVPHDWVTNAVERAYIRGRGAGRLDAAGNNEEKQSDTKDLATPTEHLLNRFIRWKENDRQKEIANLLKEANAAVDEAIAEANGIPWSEYSRFADEESEKKADFFDQW